VPASSESSSTLLGLLVPVGTGTTNPTNSGDCFPMETVPHTRE